MRDDDEVDESDAVAAEMVDPSRDFLRIRKGLMSRDECGLELRSREGDAAGRGALHIEPVMITHSR